MLECEGYKMFKGSALIVPRNPNMKSWRETGTWLYKPEYKYWYVNGKSLDERIVKDIQEEE